VYKRQDYDHNGNNAKAGTINTVLLAALLHDPFFNQPPPKSTGREYFTPAWLHHKLQSIAANNLSNYDVQATLLAATATTITNAIKNYAPNNSNVYLCGGGANNGFLQQTIAQQLKQNIQTTAAIGIDPNWVEAALFAWLAKQTYNGCAIDLSVITGAKQAVLLGGIYHIAK